MILGLSGHKSLPGGGGGGLRPCAVELHTLPIVNLCKSPSNLQKCICRVGGGCWCMKCGNPPQSKKIGEAKMQIALPDEPVIELESMSAHVGTGMQRQDRS